MATIDEHEIPQRAETARDGAELAPGDITPVNRTFYTVVVGGLMLALLFGLVAWFILTLRGETMPEGMAVLVGSIAGGLVALITKSDSA